MLEIVKSVRIDIGTSTTQLVISRLMVAKLYVKRSVSR